MSFRRKLLLLFALAITLSVAAVTWSTSAITRRAFEHADEQRTAALVSEFHNEFHRRGDEVVHRIEVIASSEAAARMALSLTRDSPDYGTYLSEAKNLADSQQLDFLEFVDRQGTIISSAQWPAKFGYKEPSVPPLGAALSKEAFLRQEPLPDSSALSLSAIREVSAGDKSLYVIGGRRIDKNFLASLDLPPGMRAVLYQNASSEFSAQQLQDASGSLTEPDRLGNLVRQVQREKQESTELIHWSSDPAADETVHAIPLTGQNSELLGILLIGNSRRPYVELQQRIRSAALLAGGWGIVLAILLSSWAAAKVTRPVEQLADAAREVARGNWNTQVEVSSSDELEDLAQSFNRMTHELTVQREKLVQTERVAAWRELARRLAHELKNPLFPLQLTVENLIRAREQSPEMFEEILKESSSTLLAEIANLKAIISRFSEFSKMPQPQLQRVQLNGVVQNVVRLFQAQFHSSERPPIVCKLDLDPELPLIAADLDLLHRAISNLVLNAMDAMPKGGTLTLRTRPYGERVTLEISDTGSGLTPEECERLFTPYYTSKAHGTGLGLAIVQSVVTDHDGRISVRSRPGEGTTFSIELPDNLEKLNTSSNPIS
jgi:two-component system nitrogen regulation sensor histidine kinase NtrY